MENSLKRLLGIRSRKTLIILVSVLMFLGVFPFLKVVLNDAKAELEDPFLEITGLITIQNNSLASVSNPLGKLKVTGEIMAIITAYSSTPEETDETPFITAAGTIVRDGIVANNLLPFGAKIRIPELYKDKVFIVEDRMNARMEDHKFDIWFANTQAAKNFGVKNTYIEILEN
ncbi:hypothetical protein ACFLYY_00225 [Patescibacteria group bacterium]